MPKQLCGVWLPDDENYLTDFLPTEPVVAGAATFQWRKFAAAIPKITTFRHAVDVGAHCGLWSRVMAQLFGKLTAFEPLPQNVECWWLNVVDTRCEVTLHQCALGKSESTVRFTVGKHSCWSHVYSDKTADPARTVIEVPVKTLDSFALTEVDFLKIDVEGFELFVVKGGEQTIRRWKPTIVIEQKPNNAERYGAHWKAGRDLLQSWGASDVYNIGDDHVMRWKNRD